MWLKKGSRGFSCFLFPPPVPPIKKRGHVLSSCLAGPFSLPTPPLVLQCWSEEAESIVISGTCPFPGLSESSYDSGRQRWCRYSWWESGSKLDFLYKPILFCLYQKVLKGRLGHGGCCGNVRRPITRPHLPKGSTVRTDVPWEQLGVVSSQLHLQLKLVFARERLVICFLCSPEAFLFAWTAKMLPCSELNTLLVSWMRFGVVVLSWMLSIQDADAPLNPRWMGACTKWPWAVPFGYGEVKWC